METVGMYNGCRSQWADQSLGIVGGDDRDDNDFFPIQMRHSVMVPLRTAMIRSILRCLSPIPRMIFKRLPTMSLTMTVLWSATALMPRSGKGESTAKRC